MGRIGHTHQVTETGPTYWHYLDVDHRSEFGDTEHEKEIADYKLNTSLFRQVLHKIKDVGGIIRRYRKKIIIPSASGIAVLTILGMLASQGLINLGISHSGDIVCEKNNGLYDCVWDANITLYPNSSFFVEIRGGPESFQFYPLEPEHTLYILRKGNWEMLNLSDEILYFGETWHLRLNATINQTTEFKFIFANVTMAAPFMFTDSDYKPSKTQLSEMVATGTDRTLEQSSNPNDTIGIMSHVDFKVEKVNDLNYIINWELSEELKEDVKNFKYFATSEKIAVVEKYFGDTKTVGEFTAQIKEFTDIPMHSKDFNIVPESKDLLENGRVAVSLSKWKDNAEFKIGWNSSIFVAHTLSQINVTTGPARFELTNYTGAANDYVGRVKMWEWDGSDFSNIIAYPYHYPWDNTVDNGTAVYRLDKFINVTCYLHQNNTNYTIVYCDFVNTSWAPADIRREYHFWKGKPYFGMHSVALANRTACSGASYGRCLQTGFRSAVGEEYGYVYQPNLTMDGMDDGRTNPDGPIADRDGNFAIWFNSNTSILRAWNTSSTVYNIFNGAAWEHDFDELDIWEFWWALPDFNVDYNSDKWSLAEGETDEIRPFNVSRANGVWHFDTNLDDDALSNDWSNNGVDIVAGKWTNSILLKDSGDYLYQTSSASLNDTISTGNFTVEAWVNVTGEQIGSGGMILDNYKDAGVNAGIRLYISSNGALRFEVRHETDGYQDLLGTTNLTDTYQNQWVHVAGRFNGSYLSVFVNGTEENNEAFTMSGISPSPHEWTIGTKSELHATQFYGEIDEVRIYNDSYTTDYFAYDALPDVFDTDDSVTQWGYTHDAWGRLLANVSMGLEPNRTYTYSDPTHTVNFSYSAIPNDRSISTPWIMFMLPINHTNYTDYNIDIPGEDGLYPGFIGTNRSGTIYDEPVPGVTFTSPADGWNSTSNCVPINFTPLDAIYNSLTFWWIVDNTVEDEGDCTNNTVYDRSGACILGFGEGWHYTNVTIQNNHPKNYTTPTRIFYIDTIPPVVEFTDETPGNDTYWLNHTVHINITVTEEDFGGGIAFLEWDNGTANNLTMTCDGSSSCYLDASGWVDDSEIWYRVFINDSLGNANVTALRYFDIDTTPPDVEFVSPTPTNASTQNDPNDIFVNFTYTEADSVSVAFIEWDNGTAYNFTATDHILEVEDYRISDIGSDIAVYGFIQNNLSSDSGYDYLVPFYNGSNTGIRNYFNNMTVAFEWIYPEIYGDKIEENSISICDVNSSNSGDEIVVSTNDKYFYQLDKYGNELFKSEIGSFDFDSSGCSYNGSNGFMVTSNTAGNISVWDGNSGNYLCSVSAGGEVGDIAIGNLSIGYSNKDIVAIIGNGILIIRPNNCSIMNNENYDISGLGDIELIQIDSDDYDEIVAKGSRGLITVDNDLTELNKWSQDYILNKVDIGELDSSSTNDEIVSFSNGLIYMLNNTLGSIINITLSKPIEYNDFGTITDIWGSPDNEIVSINDGSYNHNTSILNITYEQSNGYFYYHNFSDMMGDSENWYRVFINDSLGNMNVSELRMVILDLDSPSYSSISQDRDGNPDTREDVYCNVTWTDARNMTYVLFESNYTGSWANYTLATDGSDGVFNYTIDKGNWSADQIYGWRYWANDSGGNMNVTPIQVYQARNYTFYMTYYNGTSYFENNYYPLNWSTITNNTGTFEPHGQNASGSTPVYWFNYSETATIDVWMYINRTVPSGIDFYVNDYPSQSNWTIVNSTERAVFTGVDSDFELYWWVVLNNYPVGFVWTTNWQIWETGEG